MSRTTSHEQGPEHAAAFRPAAADAVDHVRVSPQLVREFRIFVDTSSLCAPDAQRLFLGELAPLLQAARATVLVSDRTLADLERRQGHSGSERGNQAIAQARHVVATMLNDGQMIHCPDPHPIAGDRYATSELFTDLFVGFQLSTAMCLITQDRVLALRILQNARSEAFDRTRRVEVYYVDAGRLRNWANVLRNDAPVIAELGQRQARKGDLTSSVAKNARIVVDTSTLMLSAHADGSALGARFMTERLLPELAANRNPLLVPYRVVEELDKHLNSSDADRQRLARAGKDALHQCRRANLLSVGRDEQEVDGSARFADPVFLRVAIRFRRECELCIITQDRNLARTLVESHATAEESGQGHPLTVAYVDFRSGRLTDWIGRLAKERERDRDPGKAGAQVSRAEQGSTNRTSGTKQRNGRKAKPGASAKQRSQTASRGRTEAFATHTRVRPVDSRPIALARLPQPGDTLSTRRGGSIRLGQKIAEGGEGAIHQTDRDDTVCKVYHQDCLTEFRRAKLELMTSRHVDIPGVCWPSDIVMDGNATFVGYLMPKAAGKTLKMAVFAKPLLKRTFPNWTRIQLTELALTIARTIDRLHAINVLIGDINPQNILVESERRIHIVDADSFQVEDFPCPVGTDTFTPAERQGQNFATFLRSKSDELFAVATLLFMVLLPGKTPYSSQGGGEARENIAKRHFPYARREDGERNTMPRGQWQFIWSHMLPRLKQDFLDVFDSGKTVEIRSFVEHLEQSIRGMRTKRNSDELFPAAPWLRPEYAETTQCNMCGTEHQVAQRFMEKLRADGRGFRCNRCVTISRFSRVDSSREVQCTRCGKRQPAAVSHLERLAARGQPYLCKSCGGTRSHAGKTHVRMNCTLCGVSQKVSPHHLERIRAQGKDYWCRPCADQRRAAKQTALAPIRVPGKRKWCFVATAVYGRNEGHELDVLRTFRDEVLESSALGRAFVRAYYRVGPVAARIVTRIPAVQRPLRAGLGAIVRHLDPHHAKKADHTDD